MRLIDLPKTKNIIIAATTATIIRAVHRAASADSLAAELKKAELRMKVTEEAAAAVVAHVAACDEERETATVAVRGSEVEA